MTTLAAARVITPDRVLEPGVLEIDAGRIVTAAPTSGPVPPRTLVPGFVDLQVNGVDDVDVATPRRRLVAARRAADRPRRDDVGPDARHRPAREFRRTPGTHRGGLGAARGASRDRGAHLEGPFLGEMHGAHPSDLVRPLDLEWLAALPARSRS